MQQLRSAYFTPEEIAGLFSASDAYDLDAIARLEISSDASLTGAERKQKLAALDARLPQQTRAEREAPTRVLRLEEAVASARTQGADDNEVYRMRSAAISRPPPRLADLDREEADWQRRISAYQSQRRQLQQSAANGPLSSNCATAPSPPKNKNACPPMSNQCTYRAMKYTPPMTSEAKPDSFHI
jgi:lipase chaperone LimK